jgi:predicted amidohydrolase YtcJ
MGNEFSRGEFLGIGGILATGLGLGRWPFLDAAGRPRAQQAVDRSAAPDMILVNGNVYTVDESIPRAEAFAVKDGFFTAVGSSDDVRNLAEPNTRVVDAGGMTVTPGFIDSHCHPRGTAELYDVFLAYATTIGEVKRRLAERARETEPGWWVDGARYDDTKVVDESTGRYRRINRWDLDEAVPDHPCRVTHRGGHIAWYNSKALELAGVDRNTPDPKGGRFERDENGERTGLVEEPAQEVFDGIARRPELGRAEQAAARAHISKLMTAAGLTSVHHTGGQSEDLIALQDAYRAGELRFRMYFFPRERTYRALSSAGIRTGFGDAGLRIGAVPVPSIIW